MNKVDIAISIDGANATMKVLYGPWSVTRMFIISDQEDLILAIAEDMQEMVEQAIEKGTAVLRTGDVYSSATCVSM